MSNEIIVNQIKHYIISNLAVNETILVDLLQYNDVIQGNTFLAFTQSRIFYWHETDGSNKLRAKSYNLIKTVMVSHGTFSIHFNDEIIKLLLPDTSNEAHKMIEILSQFVTIQYPQVEKSIIAARKENKRKGKTSENKQSKINLPKALRYLIPVLLVIVLSVVGTLTYSTVVDWLKNQNLDNGLTTEKVDMIKADIAAVEQRVFMFEEYEQIVNNYKIQLESIASEINSIDPSNKEFDWVAAVNRISNFKMTLYNLPPKEFLDNGKIFDLDNQYMTQKSKYFYDRLNQLLDETTIGLETKFGQLTELIRLEQEIPLVKDEIQSSINDIKSEIGKLNAYIQEQKALINQ